MKGQHGPKCRILARGKATHYLLTLQGFKKHPLLLHGQQSSLLHPFPGLSMAPGRCRLLLQSHNLLLYPPEASCTPVLQLTKRTNKNKTENNGLLVPTLINFFHFRRPTLRRPCRLAESFHRSIRICHILKTLGLGSCRQSWPHAP